MVAILTDKSYADSLWSKQLFSSLTECLRSRRIPFCQIEDSCPAQCDTVFIITSDYAWTSSTVQQLNKSGRIPILLCNQYENLPGCVYSCVCSDVNSSMKNLLESLLEEDRKRICMFGMNPSSISDISAFENCKKLVWVELAYCSRITDISVFKDHPTLKYLNISFTGVRDISPIQDVAMERFNCMGNKIGADAQNTYTSAHPDCIALFAGKQPYGYGWRYNDNGYTFVEYYANMRKYFRYGEPGYVGNQKGKETPATYLIID